jgi:hypothetical protein
MHDVINFGFSPDESKQTTSPFTSHRRTLPLNLYGKLNININVIPDAIRIDALNRNVDQTNIFSLK